MQIHYTLCFIRWEKDKYCILTHIYGIQKDSTDDPTGRATKETEAKEQTIGLVGEAEGGMIWESSIETCTLPYVKQTTVCKFKHDAGHPKPLLWDNPEGEGREGGGRVVQDRGGAHAYLWPIHVDTWQKTSQYCKVIILQLK